MTKDSSNVVSLRGHGIPVPPDEPVQNVVDRCRQLLAMAESGQLRGIAVATVESGDRSMFYWSYDDGPVTWHVMSSAICGLFHEWIADNVTGSSKAPPASPAPPDAPA